MSIALTGAQGLLTRIGQWAGIVGTINLSRGTTIPPLMNTAVDGYASPTVPNDQSCVNNAYSYLSSYQSSPSGFLTNVQSIAQATVISMAQNDQLQKNYTLNTSLNTLISQMQTLSEFVKQSTVSGVVTPLPGNFGDAVIVYSLKNNLGLWLENIYTEIVTGTVTQDSYTGATAYQEQITFTGAQATTDRLNWAWPGASGCNASFSAINPIAQSQQTGIGNRLNNSSFENWTIGVPNNWILDIGSIVQESSPVYDGSSSLGIVGDGSTLVQFHQLFGNSLGTTSRISIEEILFFNMFFYLSSSPAAGTLEVALVDATTNILTDYQGIPNFKTVSLPVQTSGMWIAFNHVFRSSNTIPSVYSIRIRLAAALSGGTTLYLDRAALTGGVNLYRGGPTVAVFSGQRLMVNGDTYFNSYTNNRQGTYQTEFDMFMDMKGQNLLLPSTTGPGGL